MSTADFKGVSEPALYPRAWPDNKAISKKSELTENMSQNSGDAVKCNFTFFSPVRVP